MASRQFSPVVLATMHSSKTLGVRAGSKPHRFVGIWMVVVRNRLFVRSWTVGPGGWYDTFLKEHRGVIKIGTRRVPVRAIHTSSDTLKDEVSRAYAEKYPTPGSRPYVVGFRSKRRKNATLELVPGQTKRPVKRQRKHRNHGRRKRL
jgi:hypothetical protein